MPWSDCQNHHPIEPVLFDTFRNVFDVISKDLSPKYIVELGIRLACLTMSCGK